MSLLAKKFTGCETPEFVEELIGDDLFLGATPDLPIVSKVDNGKDNINVTLDNPQDAATNCSVWINKPEDNQLTKSKESER